MEVVTIAAVDALKGVGRHVRRNGPSTHVRDDVLELGGNQLGCGYTSDG
jgi:hypothetical protein